MACRCCYILVLILVFLTGCDRSPSGKEITAQTGSALNRVHDEVLISQGAEVFRANCAGCHGAKAHGDPEWRKKRPDGKYPPPPLDGSGHAWHHSIPVLKKMITGGSPPDQGDMPAWGNKLTDQEIDAVIAWFQSLWPDQAYTAWNEMQQREHDEP